MLARQGEGGLLGLTGGWQAGCRVNLGTAQLGRSDDGRWRVDKDRDGDEREGPRRQGFHRVTGLTSEEVVRGARSEERGTNRDGTKRKDRDEGARVSTC